MQSATLHRVVTELGENEALDPPAQRVLDLARRAIPSDGLHDTLRGTFLGHALHPLTTDIPIGTWTSAMVLDLVGGRGTEKAARRLIGAGILASLPTAVTGAVEWADNAGERSDVRRIGVVHAAANVTALGLYSASYLARRRRRGGRLLALAGGAALAVGGHLGGHLAYADGVGVEGRDAADALGAEARDAADEVGGGRDAGDAVPPPTDPMPG